MTDFLVKYVEKEIKDATSRYTTDPSSGSICTNNQSNYANDVNDTDPVNFSFHLIKAICRRQKASVLYFYLSS